MTAAEPPTFSDKAEKEWKQMAATLNGLCSVCGKKMQEHTLRDIYTCKEKYKENLGLR